MTKLQEIRALQSLLPDRIKEIQSMQECLNPCLNGRWSLTNLTTTINYTSDSVLILV